MEEYLDDKYDVVVVGGGPAGSVAALTLAKVGIKTLLVEKRAEVGTPIRCGEAVTRQSLEPIIAPRRQWISQVVNGGFAHSPGGIKVGYESDEIGFVLDREIFDRDLFAISADSGAHTLSKTEVVGLLMDNGRADEVRIRDPKGRIREIKTEAVIGADGVESLVGRYAGISTHLEPRDTHTCAQYFVAGVSPDPPDAVHFYIGNNNSPGGYAWVFPKGNELANIGL
ncbi:MAG: NAD(P)/FAD-dependent oxidoreductase, partial [bacterium]|nr:NAD(P)/FAD-dependent oxidoreductase [bacterium]